MLPNLLIHLARLAFPNDYVWEINLGVGGWLGDPSKINNEKDRVVEHYNGNSLGGGWVGGGPIK